MTSDGGVHPFHATWYGSMGGKLPAGVTAVGIAVDPATSGYWILKSNGGVNEFNAPWYGSLSNHVPPAPRSPASPASNTRRWTLRLVTSGTAGGGRPSLTMKTEHYVS